MSSEFDPDAKEQKEALCEYIDLVDSVFKKNRKRYGKRAAIIIYAVFISSQLAMIRERCGRNFYNGIIRNSEERGDDD